LNEICPCEYGFPKIPLKKKKKNNKIKLNIPQIKRNEKKEQTYVIGINSSDWSCERDVDLMVRRCIVKDQLIGIII